MVEQKEGAFDGDVVVEAMDARRGGFGLDGKKERVMAFLSAVEGETEALENREAEENRNQTS